MTWSSVPAALLLQQHLAMLTTDFQSLQGSCNQELLLLRVFCWLFFFSFPLFFSPQTSLWERVPQHRITLFGCQILLTVGCSQEACMPLPEKLCFSVALNLQHPSGSQGRKEQPYSQPKAFIFFLPPLQVSSPPSHPNSQPCSGPALSAHSLHTTGLQFAALAPNGAFKSKGKPSMEGEGASQLSI